MRGAERLTEGDIPGIVNIESACFAAPWSRDSIESCMALPGYFFAGVKSADGLAAYGGMQIVLDEASITNIAVLEAARRKGYGQAVLEELIDLAKQNGAKTMFLEVRASNISARELYKKNRFAQTGIRRNFYRRPDEDAVIMTKMLENQKEAF